MGRRRRVSSSTVATIDNVQFPWSKETSVLKPVPKDLSDDEWPTFVLTDAVVYEKDGRTIGNPLFINKVGPMIVRGNLEVNGDPEVISCLLKPNIKSASIEIASSQRYSIGYNNLALWVSGVAGWFEIRPAPQYEPMYLEICEAVTLYYEALNVYDDYEKACGKGRKKKPKNPPPPPTLDNIFFEYAIGAGNGVTRDEAEARYLKWAPFLVSHFPKETDVKWEGTRLYEWIHEYHSRTAPALKNPKSDDEQGGPSLKRSRSRSTGAQRQSSGVQAIGMAEMISPQPLVIRKGKEKALVETPVPLPPQYRSSVQSMTPQLTPTPVSDSPVEQLLDVLQEIASEKKDLMKATPSTFHTQLYYRCRVKTYNGAPDVTAYYAKELLPLLGPEWKGSPFYKYLKEASQKPFTPQHTTVDKIPSQVARRAKGPTRSTPSNAASTALPPPINIKSKPRKTAWADDESEEEARPGKRSRKSGKGASLRLVSSAKKRPASEIDSDDSGGGRGRGAKSLKLTQVVTSDEDDEMEEANESSNPESQLDGDVDDDDDGGDGDRFPVPPPKGSVRVVIHAERIPTMSPTGPNGTWTCDQEGCGFVVRAAEEQAGQDLIQEHFRGHEAQLEKINLARQESRGHMPINHLLDKIQALGQRALQNNSGTLNNVQLVPPIKRRLLL